MIDGELKKERVASSLYLFSLSADYIAIMGGRLSSQDTKEVIKATYEKRPREREMTAYTEKNITSAKFAPNSKRVISFTPNLSEHPPW